MDAQTQSLLHYPLFRFIEATFQAESLGMSPNHTFGAAFRHRNAITKRLQHCVEDELTLHTTLAWCASCIKWSLGCREGQVLPELYIAKALQAMREQLLRVQKDPTVVDHWLILSTYALSVSEMWLDYPSAAATHMSMVRYFLDVIDRGRDIDPYIRESMVLGDKYLALKLGTTPMLPMQWEPTPLTEQELVEISQGIDPSLTEVGKYILQLRPPTISMSLVSIIHDVVTCIKVSNYAWSEDRIRPTPKTKLHEWLFWKHQAIIYCLIADRHHSGLEQCLRITILIWLLTITAYSGAVSYVKLLLPQLKEALKGYWTTDAVHNNHNTTGNAETLGLLFWIASVGARTSPDGAEESWYVQQTALLGVRLGLKSTREQYCAFWNRYLFSPLENGEPLSRLLRHLRRDEKNLVVVGEGCN